MSAREYKALYLKAFIDFIQVFASEEVGSNIEVDIIKLYNYVHSERFHFEHWDGPHTIEEAYSRIEALVIGGFPIWDFLVVSDWTKKVLEESFRQYVEQEHQKELKLYPCLSCKYFSVEHYAIGDIERCKSPEKSKASENRPQRRREGHNYREIKKCKYKQKVID